MSKSKWQLAAATMFTVGALGLAAASVVVGPGLGVLAFSVLCLASIGGGFWALERSRRLSLG